MIMEMEKETIRCFICQQEFESWRSYVSHDNKTHGGIGLRSRDTRWCEGHKGFCSRDEFYVHSSRCKECEKISKANWENNTTKGFKYKHRKPSAIQRYTKLVKKIQKQGFLISLTKDEYREILEKEVCSYCGEGFQGVMELELVQPQIGLTRFNVFKSCMVCFIKKKFGLQ